MTRPVKRREIEQEVEFAEEDSDEDSGEEEKLGSEEEIIPVEFEGRNPQDPDFHGIQTLLKQLFLKAHINLSNLTDLIIRQNYVGSVVTQSVDDCSDDEESSGQDVFGITTVVNISEKKQEPCIQNLRELLSQHAEKYATDATNAMINNVLGNDSAPLGLLINERFINIPAQISVPLFENLVNEIKRAHQKKMPFNFEYYIIICKLKKYKTEAKKKGKNDKNAEDVDMIWCNSEEEIFAEEAICHFEFSVESESDNGLTGTWSEEDEELIPYRRVLLLEASKLPLIIQKIKTKLAS